MHYSEEIKCLKCFSLSPASMNYCRYCHQRFSNASMPSAEQDEKDGRINRKLIIVGTALAALVAGYVIFK